MTNLFQPFEEFARRVQLRFRPVEDSVLTSELSKTQSYLRFERPTETRGYCLDLQSLKPAERELVDRGELLPSLAYYWLELTVAIIRYSSQNQLVASLCVPSKRQVSILSVDDVCHEINSGAWQCGAQVAIAWSTERRGSSLHDFPINCVGAVFPIIEGMGVALRLPEDALVALGGWCQIR